MKGVSKIKDIFSKYKNFFIGKSRSKKSNEAEADSLALVSKDEKKSKGVKNKRKIENMVTFIVLLVITVIMINKIIKSDSKSGKDSKSSSSYKTFVDSKINTNSVEVSNMEVETNLEKELEEILSKMQGVGDVKVLVTYSQTSQIVPIYNESNKSSSTKEDDSEGGSRHISESDSTKEVVLDSNNDIITESVLFPKIEGAIVMAKGANNVEIKNNIIQAVCAVTGLSSHKVQVFELNDN